MRADADQEEAARLLADHGLLAITVLETDGRLLGIVTADDAAEVLDEEATEDVEKLGGSDPLDKPYLHTSTLELVWKRVRWLLVLFVAEAYSRAACCALSRTSWRRWSRSRSSFRC